jgi:hypothetical protein
MLLMLCRPSSSFFLWNWSTSAPSATLCFRTRPCSVAAPSWRSPRLFTQRSHLSPRRISACNGNGRLVVLPGNSGPGPTLQRVPAGPSFGAMAGFLPPFPPLLGPFATHPYYSYLLRSVVITFQCARRILLFTIEKRYSLRVLKVAFSFCGGAEKSARTVVAAALALDGESGPPRQRCLRVATTQLASLKRTRRGDGLVMGDPGWFALVTSACGVDWKGAGRVCPPRPRIGHCRTRWL